MVYRRRMRFAISAPNVGEPTALIELAELAESSGWHGFFLWDHLHLRRDLHLDVDDPWVVLGGCAARTTSLHLGTLVTPLARRRPHVVAKQVTTLDHMTGGKAILGVGLGVPAEEEYGAFGEPIDAKVHAAMLDEALEVVTGLWSGEPHSFAGEHYQVDGAHFLPRPVQQPRPPVWVAALWPHRRPLRRAARWDGVVPLNPTGKPLTPEIVQQVVGVIAELRSLDGFDVVVTASEGVDASEYAEAGATWVIESIWPHPNGWYDELRAKCAAGPPR
jgi:alkanesulfonate monooxygenase SsuD/methylene tetrahydromethanopterin reductase-like flavin-dependent oxidoreductase (luciferase family)